MADDTSGRRPLRPVYRRSAPPRPVRRPLLIWTICGFLLVTGLVRCAVAVPAVWEIERAETSDALLFTASILLSAGQIWAAVRLFAGARQGRNLAAVVCTVDLILVILLAAGERLPGYQLWLAGIVTLVLLFALLGPTVYAWTGGDADAPAGRSRR